MKPVAQNVMARVWAVLKSRDALTRAKVEGRPKAQVTVDGDVTDLMIYDEISWWGICAQDVAELLNGVTGNLNVRINSPGGDVFDAVAIYNMLLDYDGDVTVTVDGLAASAASFVAMSGDTIRMNRASQMMIHDAMTAVYGNAAYMTEVADLLDKLSDTIAGIYADRTGVAASDWRTRMRAETWYDGAEAVKAGLATEMTPARRKGDDGEGAAAAAATFDLSVFTYAGRSAAPAPPANTATVEDDTTDLEDADVEADPPADPAPAPAPVEPTPVPDPAAADPTPTPDDPAPDPVDPAVPDDWATATAHLTTSPVDEWARLREALL